MEATIVIVEDEWEINEAIAMSLQKAGMVVHSFLSISGFQLAGIGIPHLYLIDRQLEDGDGLLLCSRIRSAQETRHVPVIMMSASTVAEQEWQQAGAHAFLEKPFTRTRLLSVIQQCLSATNDANT